MPEQKAPCSGAFLPASLMYFCSGTPMQFYSGVDKRVRPLKPVTLRTRRAELQGAARMAVKAGVPVENINSLAALLAPEVAEQVLEAYCKKNGEKPKLYTIDLAGRLVGRDRTIG